LAAALGEVAEELGLLVERDARPRVPHAEQDLAGALAASAAHRDLDAPAGGRELEGVREEVRKDLGQALGVGRGGREVRLAHHRQRQTLAVRPRQERRHGVPGGVAR
jgi:hypothetical protein